jgi:tetratricopeptide (TPR) repeat protein
MVAVIATPVIALSFFVLLVRHQPIAADEMHYTAGVELHQQGQLYQAIVEYDVAIRLNPVHVEAYSKRGAANFARDELAQALGDYNHAISLRSELVGQLGSPKVPPMKRAIAEAYVGRAKTYTVFGKDEEAQRDIGEAVKMGYDHALAKEAIEEIRQRR